MKKILVACMALLIFAGVIQTEVKAEQYYNFDDTPILEIWNLKVAPNKGDGVWRPLGNYNGDKVEVVKVTQSKKILKNLKPYNSYDEESKRGHIGISYLPKKVGTTILRITVECNGKKKVHKVKLQVVQYKSPFKTLKIGNKNYEKKLVNKEVIYTSKPKKNKNVKLSFKIKKGYKIESINYYYYNKDGSIGEEILKNGQRFKLRKNSKYISIMYRRKIDGYDINRICQCVLICFK